MVGKSKGGFITMVMSAVAIVLFVTLFQNVMDALDNLLLVAGIGDFKAFEIIIIIAPTVLMLSGVIGSGIGYYKGYSSVSKSGGDTAGLIRMVMGLLVIVLFITLFETIATAFVDMLALYAGGDYIAFETILTIIPTLLFIGGIFAGVATTVGGYRSRRKKKALAF